MPNILDDHRAGEFALARVSTLHGAGLRDVALRLGATPEDLVALADEFAARVVAPSDSERNLERGSTAFVCGLLEGVALGRAAGRAARSLQERVSDVVQRGAHPVIAAHCDLAAVVAAERQLSTLILSTSGLAQVERDSRGSELARLFELGLAIGLAGARGQRRRGHDDAGGAHEAGDR